MLDQTRQTLQDEERLIPASGGEAKISSDELNYYQKEGFEILPSNQLEWVPKMNKFEALEFAEESDGKIRSFLQGNETAPWVLFYIVDSSKFPGPLRKITHGLVDRDITSKIKASVERLEKETTSAVVRLAVIHRPGAGATTIGRHVLWQLRKKARCVIINGDDFKKDQSKLDRVAHLILSVRELQEQDDQVWF